MKTSLRYVMLAAAFAAVSSVASAGDLRLTIGGGRATLIAEDVPLTQILAEWERVGKTTIVNGDKLAGPPVTMQVVDRPEREVLEMLLRSASGYIAAPRRTDLAAGPSIFETVRILPTSKGPVGVASATPAPFGRPQMPPPVQSTVDDDPVESTVGPGSPAPGNNPNQMSTPGQLPVPPGQVPGAGQAPLTAPRPGMLPAPPPGQPNPYGPNQPPIVRPPGTGPGGRPGAAR